MFVDNKATDSDQTHTSRKPCPSPPCCSLPVPSSFTFTLTHQYHPMPWQYYSIFDWFLKIIQIKQTDLNSFLTFRKGNGTRTSANGSERRQKCWKGYSTPTLYASMTTGRPTMPSGGALYLLQNSWHQAHSSSKWLRPLYCTSLYYNYSQISPELTFG